MNNISLYRPAAILCFSVLMFLFCTRDYNPFTDPNNSDAHVLSWTFSGRDSVPIYETGTLNVAIAVREEMDSVRITAPKNRYWADTTVRKSGPNGMMNQEYSFKISFFDTGNALITIQSYRSNGDVLKQDSLVHVFNPLFQMNVYAFFGDTVNLLTMDVADKNVLYHWKLDTLWYGYSATSQLSDVIPLFYPNRSDGKLWVTDLQHKFASPPVGFAFTLKDTLEPAITCINAGAHDDTIITGDTLFPFMVTIIDKACAEVESCSVNGMGFDFVNSSTRVYTKLFHDLPGLVGRSQNNLLAIHVFALDNVDFRNTSRRTFYVGFDPAGSTSEGVSICFNRPDRDTFVTSPANRSYRIHGTLQGNHDNVLTLVCQANGTNVGSPWPVTGSDVWSWLVPLASPFTTVKVSAYDAESRLCASAERVIVFRDSAADAVKPVIWQISSGGEVIGSEFMTNNEMCNLKIVAFDDGAGLAYLVVNHDTLAADTAITWYKNIDGLIHSISGNIVRIVAVDKSNNRQERTIKIFRNSIPEVTADPFSEVEVCAGQNKSYQIEWSDAEGDGIGDDVIKKPATMSITGVRTPNTRLISWLPMLRTGTDRDTLIIELGDAYGKKNRYLWEFRIKNCSLSPTTIKFKTTVDDFPSVLQADVERLMVTLSVNQVRVVSRLQYGARLIDRNMTLLDRDTSGVVQWSPTLSDTGYRRFMITVGDDADVFDTLLPAVRVVPRNQYPCSLSVRFSGSSTTMGHLDLFTHPAAETLYFTINDKDPPIAELYNVSIDIGALHSVQTLNKREFKVVVERDTSKMADTLVVMVIDRNNSADTLQQILRYFPSNANIPPEIAGGPDFPPYFCVNREYQFQIKTSDGNGNIVVVLPTRTPAGMSVTPAGAVGWEPSIDMFGDDTLIVRLSDGADSSGPFAWPVVVVDCDQMPPPVSFLTRAADFPTRLQAEKDSLNLQLQITPGEVALPLSYEGYLDGRRILDNGTGECYWKPSYVDVGVHTLEIIVSDRYGRKDTISPVLHILPKNQHACTLSYNYSGPELRSELFTLFSTAQPESAMFTIEDEDDPATERYTVRVSRRGTLQKSYDLAGDKRTFSVYVTSPTVSTVSIDTFVVSVKDSTGSVDTNRFIVRYPIAGPSNISQLSLSLDASSGVTTQMGSTRITRWADQSGRNGITQSESGRQPTVISNYINTLPAVFFDHQTDNGDDGLFNTTYGEWAATPFTVFVVFSARAHTASTRQALITTNLPDGFGVGIGCDQTISIFNDINSQGCSPQDSASSGLQVATKTWYVASFKANVGITVRGEIQVLAWLNGTAASKSMVMTTQSGSGLAVGTGSSGSYSGSYGRPGGTSGGFNGSFDGWIASVVIYQRALSDDERSLVERYLGSRYGITIK